MDSNKKEITISIRDSHLPLLKESLAKSKYKEKIDLDATHSYTYKVDYNPRVIRLLLSDEEYYQDVVESFLNPEQTLIEMPYATFIHKCIFYNILAKETRGLKGVGIPHLHKKLKTIKSMTSLNTLKHLAPSFTTTVEGKSYTIDSSVLVDFMLEGHKTLDYQNPTTDTILGYDKKLFFYILREFNNRYHIAQTFVLPEDTRRLVASINTDLEVDTYAFDKITSTRDNISGDIVLDDRLVEYLLSGMKDSYTDVEKAMHIYVKMCRVLSYDPTFYAENESREVNLLHTSPSNLKNISLDNTNIVCYEFNAILGQMLKKLGINYEVKSRSSYYADGHAYLSFRADDYIVNADSLSSIIGSDLLNAKVAQELKGLTCENKNVVMRNKFQVMLQEVYQNILTAEKTKATDSTVFRKLADMMMSLNEGDINITTQDRLDIFQEICATTKLPTVEKQAYLLSMFKNVFHDNMGAKLTIVSEKESPSQRFYSPNMIISLRQRKGNIFTKNYDYYIYDATTSTWSPVSRETLQSKVDNETLHWFGTHFVPGISTPDEEALFREIDEIHSDHDFH